MSALHRELASGLRTAVAQPFPLLLTSFQGEQTGWVLLLGLGAWLFLFLREWRKQQGKRRYLRTGLTSIAMASLILIGLRPAREVRVDPSAAILLSNGAEPAVIDSLQQQLKPRLIASLDSNLAAKYPGVQQLPDLPYLQRHFPSIRRIHLLGDGLPESQLELLSDRTVVHHPGNAPPGIRAFYYRQQATEGEMLPFSGVYYQEEKELRRLYLNGPHGSTLLLEQDSPGRYLFSGEVPAQEHGSYLLQLVEEGARREVLHREPLPVVIRSANAIKVLILNGAPRFETNYLKNWLADAGYPVAVRSTISRDRFAEAFYNLPETSLKPVSSLLLRQFDLVIIDGDALAALPAAERSLLRRAVEEGLGLCVMSGATLPVLPETDRRFFLDFRWRSAATSFLPPGAEVELSKTPFNLEAEFGFFPLLSTRSANHVSGFRLREEGRVALQLAYDTYRLLLRGEKNVYGRLWTNIIEGVARQSPSESEWKIIDPLLIQPGKPATVQLISNRPHPVGTFSPDTDRLPFYFRQHPLLPEQWNSTLWPQTEGWLSLALEDHPQDSSWMYVPEAGAWSSLRRMHIREATVNWLAKQPVKGNESLSTVARSRPYPSWWFYVLFLLSAGGLWLEEKWGNAVRRN